MQSLPALKLTDPSRQKATESNRPGTLRSVPLSARNPFTVMYDLLSETLGTTTLLGSPGSPMNVMRAEAVPSRAGLIELL